MYLNVISVFLQQAIICTSAGETGKIEFLYLTPEKVISGNQLMFLKNYML